jgi:hypothetical protein
LIHHYCFVYLIGFRKLVCIQKPAQHRLHLTAFGGGYSAAIWQKKWLWRFVALPSSAAGEPNRWVAGP